MHVRKSLIAACILALVLVPLLTMSASVRYSKYAAASALGSRKIIYVIDPGHGGEDGGALSCTGVRESDLNLSVSHRLNDLLGLFGIPTRMTRTSDLSIYGPEAATVSEKKVSDLKNRVLLANQTENAVLVSVHQNLFSESRYSGAQVFYAETPGSRELAEALQEALRQNLDPSNRRQAKKSLTVYLLKKIQVPGILLECGFLSNPEEESRLRDPSYQLRLACVSAVCLCQFRASASPA